MNNRTLLTALAFVLVTFASASALASPDYPAAVVADLKITCSPVPPFGPKPGEPDCTLCHSTPAGGGAPTEPFGIALVKRGLLPNDLASLQASLKQMEADQVNSSGNGLDVDQLRACKNPNPTTSVGYGCSSSGESGGLLWVAIAAITGVVIGRRRRR